MMISTWRKVPAEAGMAVIRLSTSEMSVAPMMPVMEPISAPISVRRLSRRIRISNRMMASASTPPAIRLAGRLLPNGRRAKEA